MSQNAPSIGTATFVGAPLPRYRSHKVVEALKIQSLEHGPEGTAMIIPENTTYGIFEVSADYVNKHDPQPGGYYVRYDTGYESWSPAQAFEEGYTLIQESSGLTFGDAIRLLKQGKKLQRAGWNGKNMWIALSPGSSALPAENFWAGPNREFAEKNGGAADVLPNITMKTADNKILPGWLASQTDMLSEDWQVVE